MRNWEYGPEEMASSWQKEMDRLYYAYKYDHCRCHLDNHCDCLTYEEFCDVEYEKVKAEISQYAADFDEYERAT